MAIVLGLGAAIAYAVAVVLQRRSARDLDRSLSLRPTLLVKLIGSQTWRVGLVMNALGFVLRAAAFERGSLVLVQPLVLTGLVVALPLDALASGRSFTLRDGAASVALVAGLSVFLVAASPSNGISSPATLSWVRFAIGAAPIVGLGVAAALRVTGNRRAGWLAFTGGLALAATAALAKEAAGTLVDRGLGIFGTWTPYGLVAVTAVGVLLVQSAFHAGSLRVSLPILNVVEPLTSIFIGLALFSESIRTSPTALASEITGMTVLFGAVIWLTRTDSGPQPRAARGPNRRQDMCMDRVRRIAVVPAYNEERTVATVLDRLAPFVDELVIVDDGSEDGTRAAIESRLADHSNIRLLSFNANRGMSAAYYSAFTDLRARLRTGSLAPDDLVFTVDADGQHDLTALDDLLALAVSEQLDALLVQRDLSTYPRYKRTGNIFLSAWASAWAGSRLNDVESGYRVFRLGALCDALDYYRGYRYSETVEVAVVLCRLGYRVRNDVVVPVPLYRSRTKVRDAAIDFAAIPAAAWRVWRQRPRGVALDVG